MKQTAMKKIKMKILKIFVFITKLLEFLNNCLYNENVNYFNFQKMIQYLMYEILALH